MKDLRQLSKAPAQVKCAPEAGARPNFALDKTLWGVEVCGVSLFGCDSYNRWSFGGEA